MRICRKGLHQYEIKKGSKRGCLECRRLKDKRRANKPERKLKLKEARIKHYRKIRRPYTQYKKDKCELCDFIPVNQFQLDVDHIDGNHQNNDLNNLQTLCANCHRLKTYLNNESSYK